MCDLSYAIQAEQIERRALAELALAPHLEKGHQVTPPDVALAEFEHWLNEEPEQAVPDSLEELITGGRR